MTTSSRRAFLGTLAAGASLSAARGLFGANAMPEALTTFGAPIGLQLWSLRAQLPRDVEATLRQVREWGIVEIQSAGTAGRTAEAFRVALDAAGLRCRSSHVGFDDLAQRFVETAGTARTLGATQLVCPWLPHDGAAGLKLDDVKRAAEVLNEAGRRARAEALKVAYHCHGYEFVPSADGTLFDTLAKATDPALVGLEVDVLWAKAGGADPAALIKTYKGRIVSLHAKDIAKGLTFPIGTSGMPAENEAPVGAGQLDWPAILGAARAAGVEGYYIEDETTDPLGNIPKSIAFLKTAPAA
jgi:sugar phosphate isomerase/epimerase